MNLKPKKKVRQASLIENNNWNVFDFIGITNITSNHITKILKHPSNETVFFGTLNGGLVTYNNDFTFYNNDNSQLLDNTIRDLFFDENENLIMTTTFAGLGVWSSTNFWTWLNSQTNPSLPFFINSLDELVIDNENHGFSDLNGSFEDDRIDSIDNDSDSLVKSIDKDEFGRGLLTS